MNNLIFDNKGRFCEGRLPNLSLHYSHMHKVNIQLTNVSLSINSLEKSKPFALTIPLSQIQFLDIRKAYINCIRTQTKDNRIYHIHLRYYARRNWDNWSKKQYTLFENLTQLTPNANKNLSPNEAPKSVPYKDIKYCNECQRSIFLDKYINIFLFLFLLFTFPPALIIYLIYYILKTRKCPICGSQDLVDIQSTDLKLDNQSSATDMYMEQSKSQQISTQTTLRYCKYCGSEVNSKYCTNCGVKIE